MKETTFSYLSQVIDLTNLIIEDLRNTVIKLGGLTKRHSLVRVSDEYWVYLKDGKSTLRLPHLEVQKLYQHLVEKWKVS